MFDGDEMNAHIPQSYEATSELQEIAAVPMQIIRPRDGTPVIGVVQDALAGAYLATREGNFFTRREFMNMMMKNKRFQSLPSPKAVDKLSNSPRYTGQQIIETLLAPINIDKENSSYDMDKRDHNFVRIREGEFLQGIVDKKIFNDPGSGILHTTYNDYGPKEAVDFLDGLQSMMETYLIMKGFSVGVSDLIADESTKKQMEETIVAKKKEIDDLILQVHMDLFTNNSGKSNQEEFEAKAIGILNKATGDTGKIGVDSLSNENRLMAMIRSGSKGDKNNVAQMIACVGQQAPEGRRIPYGFTDRTLPHYKMYDDGAEARGFVEGSFLRGLTPQEFFFHAMSGREGLIDTAVKSVTGDTPIIVLENGRPKRVKIGDWIDAHITTNQSSVEYFPEDNELEMLQLELPTYIPSVNSKGHIVWGKVAAVTRHDPGKQLYEIKTLGGRSVIVTESKSLYVWNKITKQFEQKDTPTVQVGDYLPTTMNLLSPPEELTNISVADYLPKSTYLYGTDFHKAQDAVVSAMLEVEKVPVGWWNSKNGIEFTVPYENKGRFVRTLVRSKTDNIVPGYVYPFTTNRDHARIPELFPLTEQNGIFLGLFLAEGNVDIKSGYIQITNNNTAICQFVHEWFEDMRVCTSEDIKMNAVGGVSTSVRGYSTILAKFLDTLVGHGAGKKHIPVEAYTAPLEFIRGLLNGYFSGDGTVTTTSVEASSASEELAEGITFLCSRIGVFAKTFQSQLKSNNIGTEVIQPAYRISIRAQWASKFANQVSLIDSAKQIKLTNLNATLNHRNFPVQEDVVLDEIVEIRLVSPEQYPKMYDLTVPDTFTFGLANGLQVYDTADTGYTQRQLIKAMEDLMIQHDGTVRDGTGKIVQFRYGEDGVNSTKIEKSSLPLEKLSEAVLRTEFGMEGVDFTNVLTPGTERGDDKEGLDLLVNALLKDRRMLVEGVFGGGRVGKLATPLNLERLLLNIKIKFNIQKTQPTNLTPNAVLEGIEQLIERTQSYNKIWVSSLRFHLAPHKIVVKERFTKEAWEALCAAILLKNWKAWAMPGELVGIVAAQSIGEPATQMSNVYDTFTVISTPEKTKNFAGKIGFFIDKLLEAQKENVVTIGEDSVVLDLKEPMYILGVSNDEKSSWLPISQVSRHPANGGLVEVHTRTGRKTTATLTHSFLKRSSEGIVPVLGSKLELGMRIPVAKTIPTVPNPIITLTEGVTIFTMNKLFGWVCGMYLADGSTSGNTVRICKIAPIVETKLKEFCTIYNCIFDIREYQGEYGPGKDNNIYSKDLKNFLVNTFNEGSYKKEIGSIVYHAPLEFIQGLVSGFFDGDGNVNVERQLIRASSRSRTLLEGINRLLGYCSMFGVLSEETSVRIPDKIQHTLIIPRKFADQYQQTIGFNLPEKAVALDEIVKYNSRLYVHSNQEMIDKIPELGSVIAETGLLLRMPGQSRTYGRWLKKESIGRATLENYVQNFKEMMAVHVDPESEQQIRTNLAILESALNADVFWDEITDLVYLDDPKTYVYDFTVPGNDSFMVDDNIFVHNTLNTFHQAGVAAKSAMTRGVPRLKELLKVTKNPKAISLTITLKPEFRNDKDMLRAVAQDLELTLLKDIVTKAAIYYDPSDDETVLEEDKDVIKFFKALEARKMTGGCGEEPSVIESVEDTEYSNWLIRFVFDREKMFNKNITMDDVYFVIQNAYAYYGGEKDGDSSIRTIYTDYNSQKLVMRIRPKKGHAVHGDNLAAIKKLQNLLLQNTIIRGVPGIRSVTWRKDNNRTEEINGEYKSISQYLLDTDGSNFVSVMIHPAIDGNKLYSTNVHDIYDQLGIEATRAVLYSEINGLFDDADINYRHLGLLCDSMTHAGRLMSVDRYGINKSDNGPLAKACFEETEKVLRDAAIFGEMDPVTGVSANIMMGQTIRAGTAFTQILLDEEAHAKLLQNTPMEEEEEEEEDDALNQDDIDSMLNADAKDVCSQIDAQMNLVLPTPNVNLNEEEEIELVEV